MEGQLGLGVLRSIRDENQPHRRAFRPLFGALSSPNHSYWTFRWPASSRILRAGPSRPNADPAIGYGTKGLDAGILPLRRLVTLL